MSAEDVWRREIDGFIGGLNDERLLYLHNAAAETIGTKNTAAMNRSPLRQESFTIGSDTTGLRLHWEQLSPYILSEGLLTITVVLYGITVSAITLKPDDNLALVQFLEDVLDR